MDELTFKEQSLYNASQKSMRNSIHSNAGSTFNDRASQHQYEQTQKRTPDLRRANNEIKQAAAAMLGNSSHNVMNMMNLYGSPSQPNERK